MRTIDVTKSVGKALEKFNDTNDKTDISKAGIWNLLDAVSGKDNSKFSKEAARAELDKRGL